MLFRTAVKILRGLYLAGRLDLYKLHLLDLLERIFRNVFEHGETNDAVFCAQYWPSRSTVEICIADRGIGVCNSLTASKYTKPASDYEAVHFALMPGISSKAWRHKKKKSHQKSEWDNSGYGLFFAHQLFGSLGHFCIASGGSGILINPRSVRRFDCYLKGTLVSMSLRLNDEAAIETTLDGIWTRAAAVKERLGVKSVSFASVEAFLTTGDL